MKSKPTSEHFAVFANHVVRSLPDSLRERKVILTCLLSSLPKDHDMRSEVVTLLQHLRAHDAAQLKFNVAPEQNGGEQ